MRAIMIALLILAPHAMAATLVTNGNGKVIGINDLTINGSDYDVTFTLGSPAAVYGGNAFFYEGNESEADDAIVIIRDFLNAENVEQTVTDANVLYINIPFDAEGGCNDPSHARSKSIGYRDDTNDWFQYGDFCGDPTVDNGDVFSTFALSQTQSVGSSTPVPVMPVVGLLLLALGVISLGSLRSRGTK